MASASEQNSSQSPSAAAAQDGATEEPRGTKRKMKDFGSEIMDILKTDVVAVDEGKQKIADISAKRKEIQKERKKLTAALRNENRKRQRIRKRSQWLTDADLVEVLAMRKSKKDSASSSTTPSPKAKAKGDSTA